MWCGYAWLAEPTQPFWCSLGSISSQIPNWSGGCATFETITGEKLQVRANTQWQIHFF